VFAGLTDLEELVLRARPSRHRIATSPAAEAIPLSFEGTSITDDGVRKVKQFEACAA